MNRTNSRSLVAVLTCAVSVSSIVAVHAAPNQGAPRQTPGRQPNIVFIFADNLGYGELGCYGGGILRGAPTPRIDKLAAEGTRLLNFNVEPQCTPSRSALLTGRHPIRSGTHSVPRDGLPYGLVQWEVTTAELLSNKGYAAGIFGKWHLGDSDGRYPIDQGFDEWYGIPNSSDQSFWAQQPYFDKTVARMPHVLAGRKGEKVRPVKVYGDEARREIDLELTEKTIEFMKASVRAAKPFYVYVPLTQTHYPVVPSKRFTGRTGNGDWADVLAQLDWCVGQILDALDELKIRDDTLIVFASDNGPEGNAYPWRGWGGPWSGTYFTAMEGSNRVPFIIRWPGKVQAGRVSNEIVHEVDLFTTLARLGGAEVPADRAIDGVDQSEFLFGKKENSSREWLPIFFATELYAMKWRNWKVHYFWQDRLEDPPLRLGVPRLFNLYVSPQERADEAHVTRAQHGWVLQAMAKHLVPFQKSLQDYAPIPVGAPDPYRPPPRKE